MTDVTPEAPASTPPSTEAPVDTKAAPVAPKVETAPKTDPAPSRKKKYDLKVDGETETVELDLDNDEDIRKHLQMSKAAYKRMQQFAEYEKGVKGLIETLQTDPLKVLADPRLKIPEDVRKKLANSIINDEVEELKKTPEQREKERIQKEYENLKKQVEEEKKLRDDAELARMTEQASIELDRDMSAAIEKHKLPKNAKTIRYMAEALEFCYKNELNLSPEDLAPLVKKQTMAEYKELVDALSDDEFEEWTGKERLKKIREAKLKKIKESTPNLNDVKHTGAGSAKPVEEKKIPLKDFMKSLGKF